LNGAILRKVEGWGVTTVVEALAKVLNTFNNKTPEKIVFGAYAL
jgi:hypothetical protein